jgi:hypothetical protein
MKGGKKVGPYFLTIELYSMNKEMQNENNPGPKLDPPLVPFGFSCSTDDIADWSFKLPSPKNDNGYDVEISAVTMGAKS